MKSLEKKMDIIGDYYLTDKESFKHQLDFLLEPINKDLTKESFSMIFSNLHVKILYIDASRLDFICGDKIVEMKFNKLIFKDISLTPESGDIFKIEPHENLKFKTLFYLNSLLNFKFFAVIDFKCLVSAKIFDNKVPKKTDIYYGGLFKIKKEIRNKEAKVEEDTFIPLEKQEENKSYFNSPASNKNMDEKNSLLDNVKNEEDKNENNVTEEKILNISDNYNVTVSKFDLRGYEETKVHSEAMSDNILKKCVNLINQSYDTTVNHITFGILVYIDKYDWKERIASDLVFTMCILKDENSTFLIVTTYKGDIKMSIEIISDPYKKYIEICNSLDPLKNVFIHKPYQG